MFIRKYRDKLSTDFYQKRFGSIYLGLDLQRPLAKYYMVVVLLKRIALAFIIGAAMPITFQF